MKTKIFYFLPIIIMISLLSSCSNILTTNTPTPTATPLPSNTPPPPTKTPDPNMPPDATGKNSGGHYTKAVDENGKAVTYEWNQELNGWFTSHILNGSDKLNGGVFLFTGNEWGPPSRPMYMYVQEDVSTLPYLRYLNPSGESGSTLSAWMYNEIYHWRYEKTLPGNDVAKRGEMRDRSIKGTLTVPFTTPQGKNYVWKPGQTIGYKFYAIPWDDADPVMHPEFYETKGTTKINYGGGGVCRWTVYTEADGTLVVKGAVPESENLTDISFLECILNPIGEVTQHEQLPQTIEFWHGGIPSHYVSFTTKAPNPTFEIVRDQ